jgi:death-on-curing protein
VNPVFLTLEDVLDIHDDQLAVYGGSAGVRDQGAFESAVLTPQATFGGEYLHGSIAAMAAAYLFHLCQNHAFIDGNKRVAAESALVFLGINGWRLALGREEFYTLVLTVASGTMGKAELTELFAAKCQRAE